MSKAMGDEYLSGSGAQADHPPPRERQVLQLVAEGRTTKEIARLLGVGVKTAESHRTHLMDKLDIHDTAGLVPHAIRKGFVQPLFPPLPPPSLPRIPPPQSAVSPTSHPHLP